MRRGEVIRTSARRTRKSTLSACAALTRRLLLGTRDAPCGGEIARGVVQQHLRQFMHSGSLSSSYDVTSLAF